MFSKNAPQLLAESLVLAGSYAAARQQETIRGESPRPAFTIAVSRQVGAGGTSVAAAVGERLGWPVYDRELVERIAREMNLRTTLLDSVDEKRKSWLLECIEGFSSAPVVSEGAYVHHLVETVLSLGTLGECVIVGRGAAQILPPATTLRVRLVGDMEDRIRAMGRGEVLSHEEAARRIDMTERERVRFIRDHFRKDPADPRNYDLVLNTSRISYTACAGIIIETLHYFQQRPVEKEAMQLRS